MGLIQRALSNKLIALFRKFPVISVIGPRHSGKTTFPRMVFEDHDHTSLGDSNEREDALTDPRGFLRRFRKGVILDKIQSVPQLLSYIRGLVNTDPVPGRFMCTRSQQLHGMDKVSQTLAERTAIGVLLPFL